MAKLAYKPDEAAELASVGRTTIYALMASGELASFKLGRSRLIPHGALVALIERRMQEQEKATRGGS